MKRYIDASQIRYCWMYDADGTEHDGVTLQSIINRVPTADVVEVVHASWGEDGYCTKCGFYMPHDCEGNAFESPYCYTCGSKMDGERREK